MSILALDLGTRTGWALLTRDRAITTGVVEFKQDRWQGGGMRFLRFRAWLDEVHQLSGGFDQLIYEQVRRHAGTDASHLYGGWLAILEVWCEQNSVAYQGVPVGTIKRHATGKGNAPKEAMIAAARARGFSPADDNEADAIAILHWALETNGGLG
ncbi:crossover junction endodeoxyribonuclease RuvC [Rhodobacter calidifons]|jgi:Holliday junction resolvasome RuvABC endonuclease subunit|uniref:Crossover junction endodeoxyribonuclease RuvC n=1 Tax=Rhodobacter calidifons TaxID=2715277 RepID=A0ABX0G9M9_9RHOB|nr:crossover junction endodeoxyribonuclease RuvC [Rhodobacter calidifons]NHB77624.1 crossover junction endodeoxyribonuclease RuvC [Rhodobacter calidifons]